MATLRWGAPSHRNTGFTITCSIPAPASRPGPGSSATALGDDAVEAEALAKTALLSGPDGGRAVLAELGGILVRDDGEMEPVGPISARPL